MAEIEGLTVRRWREADRGAVWSLHELALRDAGAHASDPGRVELKRMRVHPRYQRRGVGELMLTELESRARELGFRTLHLDTTAAQTAAWHLYKKHGFVETGRDRVGAFELVLFEKQLPPNRGRLPTESGR